MLCKLADDFFFDIFFNEQVFLNIVLKAMVLNAISNRPAFDTSLKQCENQIYSITCVQKMGWDKVTQKFHSKYKLLMYITKGNNQSDSGQSIHVNKCPN